MTDVVILEFDVTHYINFEAHIQFPETDDIVQVRQALVGSGQGILDAPPCSLTM